MRAGAVGQDALFLLVDLEGVEVLLAVILPSAVQEPPGSDQGGSEGEAGPEARIQPPCHDLAFGAHRAQTERYTRPMKT